MTEFEAASLAIWRAALSVSHWQTGLSALTLAISSGLILYGFRLMRLGTEQRREEANQHHTETMRALEILIERTARNESPRYLKPWAAASRPACASMNGHMIDSAEILE